MRYPTAWLDLLGEAAACSTRQPHLSDLSPVQLLKCQRIIQSIGHFLTTFSPETEIIPGRPLRAFIKDTDMSLARTKHTERCVRLRSSRCRRSANHTLYKPASGSAARHEVAGEPRVRDQFP